MKKTVIFDLDGTLLYTLDDLTDSTNYALEQYDCSKCSIEQIRSFVGNGVRKLLERAMPFGCENPNFEQCLETFKSHYKDNMFNKTRPYEGITELLDELKSRGLKTAIVSNKFDAAVKELCNVYFENKIDIAIGESETIRKKPTPDSVFEVMRLFNAEPSDCVFIGDSEVDLLTAKNVGIKCISVDWGYKDREFLISHGAKNIVSDTKSLLDEILK